MYPLPHFVVFSASHTPTHLLKLALPYSHMYTHLDRHMHSLTRY